MVTSEFLRQRRPAREPGTALAYTLVEILVILGVCGILSALIITAGSRSRARSMTLGCASNLRNIGEAYAACNLNSSGQIPDTFYLLKQRPGYYSVEVRDPDKAAADAFAKAIDPKRLRCPSDDHPLSVSGVSASGKPVPSQLSYGYNLTLPIVFKNSSRITKPVNTVTFYDGDAGSVLGRWNHRIGWAENTVRYRHGGQANYLYLDGHVSTTPDFPVMDFESGGDSLAWLTDAWRVASFNGLIRVNPNNSDNKGKQQIEFQLLAANGRLISERDLLADPGYNEPGFNPNYLEYDGSCSVFSVKPHALGLVQGVMVNGEPWDLPVNCRTTISSSAMTVHLYNDKRNPKTGRAMGRWCIVVDAQEALITVEN